MWNNSVAIAFHILKNALVVVPFFVLPDYDKPFIIEFDASSSKIDADAARLSNCLY